MIPLAHKKESACAAYPRTRLRRWRQAKWSRDLVRETVLTPRDLIWPLFVTEGANDQTPVECMPGVFRYTIDRLVLQVKQAYELGIRGIALFPSIDKEKKSLECAEAWNPDNLVCRATRAIKDAVPDIGVMLDVALDPYNITGHDGLVVDGIVDNDRTNEALVRQSLVQYQAGADILGPSDMMDGRINAIRTAFEAEGCHDVLLMAYAAKYASAFYGPFRDAVQSGESLTGDKKTYQMDIGNSDEALREIEFDIQEGADAIIVKPGTFYLDICQRASQSFNIPVFAYQVSGEYAMLRDAIDKGYFEEKTAIIESLIAFKRAGCTGIISYFSKEIASNLNY